VNSVGPRGWQAGPCNTTGCINPYFTSTINHRTNTVEFGRQFNLGAGKRRPRGGAGYVYSYGYPYPVYVPVEPEPIQEQPEPEGPDAPGPTVFEHRSQYQPAPNPTPVEPRDESRFGDRNLDQQSEVPHHNMSPVSEEQVPVLIVYKDGHEQEIHNYAIVGDTLYDLGNMTAHKIKLADLDLQQTIQKNEQRGVEFNLPANRKPNG
jgi:hypothetical protein